MATHPTRPEAPVPATIAGIEPHLTPEETATVLRLSLRHVYRKIKTKELRALKSGRKWLVPRSAVIAFMNRTTYGEWK